MTGQFRDSGRRGRANTVSRRAFGQLLVGATAAAAVPLFVPARLLGAEAPSNRLRVGQIGCGRIAQVHDVPSVLKSGLADYVAVCDLDSGRAADSKEQLAAFYRKSATAAPDVQIYSNYRELLAHKLCLFPAVTMRAMSPRWLSGFERNLAVTCGSGAVGLGLGGRHSTEMAVSEAMSP